jgi:hypothetical protein
MAVICHTANRICGLRLDNLERCLPASQHRPFSNQLKTVRIPSLQCIPDQATNNISHLNKSFPPASAHFPAQLLSDFNSPHIGASWAADPNTQPTTMADNQAVEYLESLLGRTLRIHTTDTRMFIGLFKCTDAVCNYLVTCTLQGEELTRGH